MNKFLIVLVVLLVALFLMFKFLPWWASLIIIVAVVLSLKWVVPFLIGRIFMAPFKLKGKVLAGAQVTIHEVKPADAPDFDDDYDDDDYEDDDYEDDEAARLKWHYVDVTITPQSATEGFTHWEPGELFLVGMDAKPDEMGAEEGVSRIADCRVFEDGEFREDEGRKYNGPQRIELHLGVKPGVQALQFNYYFELFGNLTFEDSSDG